MGSVILSDHNVRDMDGYTFTGQLWVPAAGAPGGRGAYPFAGVDETTDGGGTQYAWLAVAPWSTKNPTGNGLLVATGSVANTYTLTLNSAAGQVLWIAGATVESDFAASGATSLTVSTGGFAGAGPRAFLGAVSTTQAIQKYLVMGWPVPCSGANVAATLAVTYSATSNFNLRLQLWGFLRDV